MEIRVDVDEALIEELDEEASLQGFDDRGAYLRWLIAHRPMSDLATTQAPAVATRVSELEERVKLLERQLDLDTPTNPDADLGDGSSTTESGGASLGDGFESKTKSETVDLEDPQDNPDPEPEEDAAEDDDIAEAIGDVTLDDE